jgi:hypothetical protein
MTRIFHILLSTTSVGWCIDAFSSIEEFYERKQESTEEFVERVASRDNPFAPFSPGDSDLGEQMILVTTSGIAKVQLEFQSSLFLSDNIFSAATAPESSFFYQNSAGISWQPMITPNFFVTTSLGVDTFHFEHDDGLNFENVTVGLGLMKIVPKLGDLSLSARYEHQYLELDQGISPDPATYHRIRVSAYKQLFSTRRHSGFLSLNGRFDLSADPASVARDEYALRLGYSYSITDNFQANAFYRLGLRNFQNIARNDTFQMVGADLTYRIIGGCFIYASALWSENNSDSGPFAQDYNSVQLGLGISYQHQFE